MIYELRTYTFHPGQLPAYIEHVEKSVGRFAATTTASAGAIGPPNSGCSIRHGTCGAMKASTSGADARGAVEERAMEP